MPSADLQQATVHVFGPYEFNPAALELRRGETRRPLTPTLSRLLSLLVSHQGDLVTREQIAEALWDSPGTVDTVSGIHVAISRLRTILSEHDGHASYIQTVVGAGYRFVSPVAVAGKQQVVPSALPGPGSTVEAPGPAKHSGRNAAVLLASLLLVAGLVWWGVSHPWNIHEHDLTSPTLAKENHPVTFNDIGNRIAAEAISPSGKFLTFADRQGVMLQTVSSGENRLLAGLAGFKVAKLAWLPDESSIVASTVRAQGNLADKVSETNNSQVWQLSLTGQAPQLLLNNAENAVASPDGRYLAYLQNGRTEIWISNAGGRSSRKLAEAVNGDTYSSLLWPPQNDRIITTRVPADIFTLADANLVLVNSGNSRQHSPQRRSAYESWDVRSGSLLAHRDDVHFTSAAIGPDGRLVYLVNGRDGGTQFAEVNTDSKTGAFRGDPEILSREKVLGVPATNAEDISVTADGKTLSSVLEFTNVDVYTANLSDPVKPGQPLSRVTRLTKHSNLNYPTSWTADSKSVIFDSGINGPISVMAQALDSDVPRPLVQAKSLTDRFAQGRMSPDNKWLLYLHLAGSGDKISAIERVPFSGGQPQVVPTFGEVESFRCSISSAGRCVLREIEGNKQFVYYELDPLHGMVRELARTSLVTYVRGDWAVSPDGSTVAAANHDPAHPSIELISLTGSAEPHTDARHTKEVLVPGYGVVLSPSWAKDGQSLFVQTTKPGERHLLRVDLKGHIMPLYQSPHLLWAVPSPDGTRIAFPVDTPGSRNVWLGHQGTRIRDDTRR